MIGKWKGTISAGARPVTIALACRCWKAAAGWGLACALDGKDHRFAVTNMGETHDHVVTWADDRNFRACHAREQDGAAMEENMAVSIAGRTMTSRSVVAVNGQEVGSFVGTLKR